MTSAQRAQQQDLTKKQEIKNYFHKNQHKPITLTDLSNEFKVANLVSILNEMISNGDIIQVRDYFRLPYKEGEDLGVPEEEFNEIQKGAKKTKTIRKTKKALRLEPRVIKQINICGKKKNFNKDKKKR